ncbi:uncharacterized protein LOC125553151 isoform X2 [Triticum urartu]|uniref:uncharacterized protein LOC125553151 isoform X2 n=1 Tax=Triticum urartu TaxID=4572 RepID=UPI00204491A1|nr:uncharacterized protein LOC125553151 isoform X2 [Triticum urartu]
MSTDGLELDGGEQTSPDGIVPWQYSVTCTKFAITWAVIRNSTGDRIPCDPIHPRLTLWSRQSHGTAFPPQSRLFPIRAGAAMALLWRDVHRRCGAQLGRCRPGGMEWFRLPVESQDSMSDGAGRHIHVKMKIDTKCALKLPVAGHEVKSRASMRNADGQICCGDGFEMCFGATGDWTKVCYAKSRLNVERTKCMQELVCGVTVTIRA